MQIPAATEIIIQQSKSKALLIAVLVVAIGIALAAYMFGVKTTTPKAEDISAAQSITQSDGSIIIARQPEPAPSKDGRAKQRPSPPPHKIPASTTEERRVAIQLNPDAFVTETGCQCTPSPVGLNLSLVRDDTGRRVIASATGGQILSALDIPIEPALMPPDQRPWAAGISYDPLNKSHGIWIERDIARLRIGAEAIREQNGKAQARLRLGWVW